jgi:hypothetical protein
VFKHFHFRSRPFILAIVLLVVGGVGVFFFSGAGASGFKASNLTAIGLIISGLVMYSSIPVFVTQFESETVLSVTILLPSIVAIAIFVYGFIGWSARVSFSNWKGLMPDLKWVGFQQYYNLFTHDPRFVIDVRNTLMFTVFYWTKNSRVRHSSAAYFYSPCPFHSSLPVWFGVG